MKSLTVIKPSHAGGNRIHATQVIIAANKANSSDAKSRAADYQR